MVSSAFFLLTKIVGLLVRVETVLILLVILALRALRKDRLRRARWYLQLNLLLMIGLFAWPVGNFLLLPLEQRYPAQPPLDRVEGIIVLGGGEFTGALLGRGLPQVNGAADRFIAGKALAVEFPEAKVLWSGGAVRLNAQTEVTHDAGRAVLQALDIEPERLLVESSSRNTAENAVLSRKLAPETLGGQWVLVTSAFHMPRAVALFCKAGWTHLVPWPVDHLAVGPRLQFGKNLVDLNTAMREWVGLIGYRATGKIDPAPTPGCLDAAGSPTSGDQ